MNRLQFSLFFLTFSVSANANEISLLYGQAAHEVQHTPHNSPSLTKLVRACESATVVVEKDRSICDLALPQLLSQLKSDNAKLTEAQSALFSDTIHSDAIASNRLGEPVELPPKLPPQHNTVIEEAPFQLKPLAQPKSLTDELDHSLVLEAELQAQMKLADRYAVAYLEERSQLDTNIRNLISSEDSQKRFVKSICGDLKEGRTIQALVRSTDSRSARCLKTLGSLWQRDDATVKALSSVDSTFNITLGKDRVSHNFATLSATKYLRAEVTRAHLEEYTMADLLKEIQIRYNKQGLTRHDIDDSFAGIGFNRMMGDLDGFESKMALGRNSLGTPAASDADIKLVFDAQKLAQKLGITNADEILELESFIKSAGTKSLMKSKDSLLESAGIDLEVDTAKLTTVQSLEEIPRVWFEKQTGYWATMRDNHRFLFGNQEVARSMNSTIQLHYSPEMTQRKVWEQYVGPNSPKGSFLKPEPPSSEMRLNTKNLARVYDTDKALELSGPSRTTLVDKGKISALGESALLLQQVKVKQNMRRIRSGRQNPKDPPPQDIYHEYSEFTKRDFVRALDSPSEKASVSSAIHHTCKTGLVPQSECDRFQHLLELHSEARIVLPASTSHLTVRQKQILKKRALASQTSEDELVLQVDRIFETLKKQAIHYSKQLEPQL